VRGFLDRTLAGKIGLRALGFREGMDLSVDRPREGLHRHLAQKAASLSPSRYRIPRKPLPSMTAPVLPLEDVDVAQRVAAGELVPLAPEGRASVRRDVVAQLRAMVGRQAGRTPALRAAKERR
jgi:hypothetical protein